ncbi:hypothetical protein [Mangrovimonas aestuarii]|uniref:hypothetical protein n=1 Tax=Mangrovimonas aestuarii TaxID=3018443 RepID=UPI002379C967|nr:hypothetical protein [Mangrovimonas aestuarii]
MTTNLKIAQIAIVILPLALMGFSLPLSNTEKENIEGTWQWENQKGEHTSVLSIKAIDGNSYQGRYCSVFFEGEKIDCNKRMDDFNVEIKMISPNRFEGTFKSNYSQKKGTLELTHYPKKGQLKLEIIDQPKGEYYLPDDAVFVGF